MFADNNDDDESKSSIGENSSMEADSTEGMEPPLKKHCITPIQRKVQKGTLWQGLPVKVFSNAYSGSTSSAPASNVPIYIRGKLC